MSNNMSNETFNDTILDRIHKEKLQPRSRWYFVSEQWFFKLLIILETLIGAVAVTTSLFVLTDHDWFAVQYLDEGLLVHTIKTVPYLWLAIIVVVLFVTDRNIKKIGHGYRYSSRKIIAASLIASISVGTALFFAGAGRYLDNYFDQTIPQYRSLVSSNQDIWVYPEQGLLSGKIISIDADSFNIIDSDDQPWNVAIDPTTAIDAGALVAGKGVKILGTMTDGSHFAATNVFPWKNK
jgi:hypothetical protein